MINQRSTLSGKDAERLILSMARYSDHRHDRLKELMNDDIKEWFERNNKPWTQLINTAKDPNKILPLIENFAGYELSFLGGDKSNVTIYQYGQETATLKGAGQLSVLDYHTKFIEALKARMLAIKNSSYSDLLTCVTYSIASVESYITTKANLWNKSGKEPKFDVERTITLDTKLNEWLFIMTNFKLNQTGAVWNYFSDYRIMNNEVFKHNATGSHVASYKEMVKMLNKFKKGIAECLFKLHLLFKEPVPSKIIRGMYLPEVYLLNN